ncbi:MAG: oligosaccharide flippase family protein [Fibrobacterota bacterium]|nr:oligosaccharide flippase family protein [Fibrobacterota bacterium]
MKVLGNSLIYTAVSTLQKAMGFFLLPVYTLYLTAGDYGRANLVLSIVNFLSIFYLFALHGAATRFEAKYQADQALAKEIWGTLFIFIIANACVLTLVLLGLRKWLLVPFLGGLPFHPYMTLGLLAVAFSPAYVLFQSNLQAKQLGKRYGLNNFCFFLVNGGLTLVFLIVFRLKAESILLALAATNGIFFIYTLIDFPKRITLAFRPAHLKHAFSYSLPLIPHSLATWAMSLVDRLILNHYHSATEVGIYSIGAQLGNIINILAVSVNQAYVPWFFEKFNQGEAGKLRIAKVSELMVLAISLCSLAVSLFAPEALAIMVSAEFRSAWRVAPFLCFGFVFGAIYFVFVNSLFINRTAMVPVVTMASAAVGVGLNLVLIPKFGMMGAAVSSILGMATSSIVALLLSNRYEALGFNWGRIYAYACGAFLLSLPVFLQGLVPPILMLALKTAILASGTMAMYLLYRPDIISIGSYLAGKSGLKRTEKA